jgi:hypothetical protein
MWCSSNTGFAVLEAPDQGEGAPTEEARSEASLPQHFELSTSEQGKTQHIWSCEAKMKICAKINTGGLYVCSLAPSESPGLFPDIPRIAQINRSQHPQRMELVKTRTKAFLYAQFNPVKTLRQLVEDRNCFRVSVLAALGFGMFL